MIIYITSECEFEGVGRAQWGFTSVAGTGILVVTQELCQGSDGCWLCPTACAALGLLEAAAFKDTHCAGTAGLACRSPGLG